MSDTDTPGRIEYVVVYDILRILPNGNRVPVCNHNADTLGGFTALELAVSARSQMYSYFSQCGIDIIPGDLEITPRLVSYTVLGKVAKPTSADDVVNVWPMADKGRGVA